MISFAWPGIIGGLAFYGLNLLDRFFVKHYHGARRHRASTAWPPATARWSWSPCSRFAWAGRRGTTRGCAAAATRRWCRGARTTTSWRPASSPSSSRPGSCRSSTCSCPRATGTRPEQSPRSRSRPWRPAATPSSRSGMNVTKRMRLLPPLAVIGAGIAVGLYFLLIPPFSFVGAAWATTAAVTALCAARPRRLEPDLPGALGLPADRRCRAAHGRSSAWRPSPSMPRLPIGPSIAVRLAITAAFPLVLLAFGYFSKDDLRAVRSRIRKGASQPGPRASLARWNALAAQTKPDVTSAPCAPLRVLVTASGAPGTAPLVRALRENGERDVVVVGCDMSERAIGRRICDAFRRVPPGSSPLFAEAVLAALSARARRRSSAPVLARARGAGRRHAPILRGRRRAARVVARHDPAR